MDETDGIPPAPDDLPEGLATTLRELDTHDLRETTLYAQRLLQSRHERTERIEPLPGEEILEVTEYPEYTKVVKRQPCGNDCSECPHGPYVYHVTRERNIDGEEQLRWVLIGERISNDS